MQKKQTYENRLTALDGLRGIAIILVFFNHIDSKLIVGLFPSPVQPMISTLFSSGTIGVTMLFMLSGFLMAYIYPKPLSAFSFLQKRYTRIFPLFISMCLVMTMLHLFPNANLVARFAVVFAVALSAHAIWSMIQKINNSILNRMIFIAFIFFQIAVALWYLFGVLNKPAILFNQELPFVIKQATITMVNMTLTLPLGNYIPMLDGVYWSLAAEILFYILYPIVFIPFVWVISKQKKIVIAVFFFSLFLLFSAVSKLSKHIFSLSMLYFPFFIYFVTGITVGHLLRRKTSIVSKISSTFHYVANPFVFALMIVLIRLTLVYTTNDTNEWVRMIWSIPLTLFLIFSISHKTSIARFFRSRILVFLGTISYSIYLSHTLVVDGLHLLFRPTNIISDILFICLASGITIIIASILYRLLEKPYFNNKVKSIKDKKTYSFSFPLVTYGIIGVLTIAVFIAYQSNFNLFSVEQKFDRKILSFPAIPKETKDIFIGDYPEVRLKVRSEENRIGIFTANLSYVFRPDKYDYKNEQQLIFQIKPSSEPNWISTATYKPPEIGESPNHPFGFPVIQDAKNKEFDIRIYLEKRNSAQDMMLRLIGQPFKIVSQVNKKELLNHPLQLVNLLAGRISNVIGNSQARIVFLELVPFILVIIFLLLSKAKLTLHE